MQFEEYIVSELTGDEEEDDDGEARKTATRKAALLKLDKGDRGQPLIPQRAILLKPANQSGREFLEYQKAVLRAYVTRLYSKFVPYSK